MKKLLFLLFLFVITNTLYAQEQYPEKKGLYQKGDSIIINKSLPVYIHITTLDDGYTYNKPFYLDTEGINFIRTKWETDSLGNYIVPKREQTWTVYADSKPPKTKIEFISSNKYVFKNKTYYSDDLKVKLVAFDEISGVKKIYYSINGTNFQEYTNLISFENNIDIKIKFYSVDNVGNVEQIEEITYFYDKNNLEFGIDDVAPVTSINKTDDILSPKDTLILKSEDFGVGVGVIYFRIDSEGYKPYDKPILLNKLEDGEHKIEFYSLDYINNQENSKIYSFYLDTKSPEIKIEEDINELNNSRKIILSAIDNKSGVYKILYQLDEKGEYFEYSEPFEINISHQKLKIVAIDNKDNKNTRIVLYQTK